MTSATNHPGSSTPPDDDELIEGYLKGEPSALERIDGWIDAVLKGRFPSLQADWQDIRQDVRMRVLENFANSRFNRRSSLHTYVYRITKNVCVDFTRRDLVRRKRTPNPRSTVPRQAEDAHSPWVNRDLLDKLLAGFSTEERRILQMVYGEHYSYQEVAIELGMPEGTVKSRVSRTKKKLMRRSRRLLGRRREQGY